jgi:nitric oxide reductase subunit B
MVWNTAPVKVAFWSLNIGLAMMALLTLLPMGVSQLFASIEHGYAYARSADFMNKPIVDMLVWMRVPGDTVFSIGALALTWFIFRLWVAPSRAVDIEGIEPVDPGR